MDLTLHGRIRKVQLEITLRCNHFCANCNRLVGICTPPDSDMEISQIEKFIAQTINRYHRLKTPLESIHLIGGEPLIHPNFLDIYHLIKDCLLGPGYVGRIEVYTNGRLPIPDEIKGFTLVSSPENKMHGNFYVSPLDTGQAIFNCGAPNNCGIAVNAFGYFPCGAGCSIIRLLEIPNQIYYDFPDDLDVWDFNLVCSHCIHGAVGGVPASPALNDPHSVPTSETFKNKLLHYQNKELKRL